MKNEALRILSGITAGSGIILALLCAGTSDARDALAFADEDVRRAEESKMISRSTENKLIAASVLSMLLGGAGLMATEKNSKQR